MGLQYCEINKQNKGLPHTDLGGRYSEVEHTRPALAPARTVRMRAMTQGGALRQDDAARHGKEHGKNASVDDAERGCSQGDCVHLQLWRRRNDNAG